MSATHSRIDILHRMPWGDIEVKDPELLLKREWLVTNGLGGYASGSISGACTRRYHGLLIAALPAPWGRTLMLNHLAEEVRMPDGNVIRLGGEHPAGAQPEIHAGQVLSEFRLEGGLPVWHYEIGRYVLEKRVVLPHRSNTAYLIFRLLSGEGRIRLRLRPSFHFRQHDASVAAPLDKPYPVTATADLIEVCGPGLPPLHLHMRGEAAALVQDGGRFRDVFYQLEHDRGYDGRGTLWSPGYFRVELAIGQQATLTASTEHADVVRTIDPSEAVSAEYERRQRLIAQADPRAQSETAAELVLAADQFIVTPTTRVADAARAHAAGDEVRTVIAGYHWFTDWGRDTMISLEGLTMVTGRQIEAGYILRTFAHYVRDGLIPNLFPEGEREGLYHTADATLWFFHALDRYLRASDDQLTLRTLLPVMRTIVVFHLRGTHFGIHVDPADGLLVQGADGYQLTWMDAKVDGWVVTPRRGKAVEINALWYNSLCLLESWLRDAGDHGGAGEIEAIAARARISFNERFWYREKGYLYDIVDGEGGNDPSLRPNQILAISLRHPVLEQSRWLPILTTVREHLLTPVGLRSLAPGDPQYKARYDGDLRSRDAAYHQGTVWAWLIGPFIDAWLKVHPDRIAEAHKFLQGFRAHLGEAGIGSISEIFDAEPPYTPRGCIAQAWSVAEVLRTWILTTA